ncbi:MAG: hypothetical protein AAF591_18080 [Verrucomicrobiota bacterium]
MEHKLKKKDFCPISDELLAYLERYGRTFESDPIYERLRSFGHSFPLFDKDGNDTLWRTVTYDPFILKELNEKLTSKYAQLKLGDTQVVDHLYVERVDFCEFGNSQPFRIRIVNQFNDNYDHFYVKIADSSRLYGLELEHILSPDRINYLVNRATLIEEHIAGIPGDVFIGEYLDKQDLSEVRIAKEFVKFNERCFARLLGDMRSYNYVVDMTPDFEETQYRVRAIDFDQQSWEGSVKMYLPQYFEENQPVVKLCVKLLNYPTIQQYQHEERNLLLRRVRVERERLGALLRCLCADNCSTPEKTEQLKEELGKHHETDAFRDCKGMGELVTRSIEVVLGKTGQTLDLGARRLLP